MGWVNTSVAYLAESSQGCPEGTTDAATLTQLFVSLLEAGGLPAVLMQEGSALPLAGVEAMVNAAYIEHTVVEADWGPPSKKQKGGGWDEWGTKGAMMKGMMMKGMKGGWGDDGWGKGKGKEGWGKGW